MRKTNWIPLLILLQVVVIAGQWLQPPRMLSVADAQVTDPGRDRLQMIDVLRSIDARLERLNGVLDSGKLQVRVATADEAKGAGGR